MRDTGIVEFLDERDGLVEFRDARADHQTVDRRTGRPGLLHQALTADLELPQIGIQEQGVELDRAAGREQRRELVDTAREDLFGDLTATGELGPVARIGRCGNDFRIDGRRRHSGQQHG